jgi:hypothetical protein
VISDKGIYWVYIASHSISTFSAFSATSKAILPHKSMGDLMEVGKLWEWE